MDSGLFLIILFPLFVPSFAGDQFALKHQQKVEEDIRER
jgi:hypothetical protein